MVKITLAKHLLEQVNGIQNHYEIEEKNSGRSFNIFRILGMETNEEKTHSRFIAELLNPKGSHNQGNLFLQLFLDYFEQHINEEELIFNAKNASVHTEHQTSEGRIDIYLTDGENVIAIENKIYAGEQNLQIERYSNSIKNNKNNYLFFLTLNGKKSETAGGAVYTSISYEKNILEWLENCKKEVVDIPTLVAAINQYIYLIKKLTGQTQNKQMEKEIKELLKSNSDYFTVAKDIQSAIKKAKTELIESQREKLRKVLIENDFEDGDISGQRAKRNNDGLFLKISTYEIEATKYDLGINFELLNNHFFFCMVKVGKNREPKGNTNDKFRKIRKELEEKFKDNNPSSNGYAILRSDDFKFWSDSNKSTFYHPGNDNTENYKKVAIQVKRYVERILNDRY